MSTGKEKKRVFTICAHENLDEECTHTQTAEPECTMNDTRSQCETAEEKIKMKNEEMK